MCVCVGQYWRVSACVCEILSMSQRSRSLKITRGDWCEVPEFFSSLYFVIRCHTDFFGVTMRPFMLWAPQGLIGDSLHSA